MKDIALKLLGSSPRTTLISLALAALYTWQDLDKHGLEDWKQLIVPFLIAFLGRWMKDSDGVNRKETKETNAENDFSNIKNRP